MTMASERLDQLVAEGKALRAAGKVQFPTGNGIAGDPTAAPLFSPPRSPDAPHPRRLTPLVDIEPEQVDWLLYPYIPRGKLTLLDGDPGVGKSWIAFAIASALSRGEDLAGKPATGPLVSIIASVEDGAGDTIRPRIEAMGADLTKIHVVEDALSLNEEGIAWIEEKVRQLGAAFVVLDPLFNFMGGTVDIHRANETRAIIAPLAEMASRTGCAVFGNRHLSKSGKDHAIYRGLGSIDFTAAARSVLLAGADPDDPSSRAVVHIKSNLAQIGPGLGYSIAGGRFAWTGTSSLTAGTILGAGIPDSRYRREEAIKFLRGSLASGPRSAGELSKAAAALGITSDVLRRAREELGVRLSHEGVEGQRGGGRSIWSLPLDDEDSLGSDSAFPRARAHTRAKAQNAANSIDSEYETENDAAKSIAGEEDSLGSPESLADYARAFPWGQK